jgi:hypothetical protein
VADVQVNDLIATLDKDELIWTRVTKNDMTSISSPGFNYAIFETRSTTIQVTLNHVMGVYDTINNRTTTKRASNVDMVRDLLLTPRGRTKITSLRFVSHTSKHHVVTKAGTLLVRARENRALHLKHEPLNVTQHADDILVSTMCNEATDFHDTEMSLEDQLLSWQKEHSPDEITSRRDQV